jgi:hypothetical protein
MGKSLMIPATSLPHLAIKVLRPGKKKEEVDGYKITIRLKDSSPSICCLIFFHNLFETAYWEKKQEETNVIL